MRWCLLVLACACGDNVRPPALAELAALPAPLAEDDVLAFDRDDTPVLLVRGGALQRLVDDRWRAIDTSGVMPIDLGSDSDGTLLVASTLPRVVLQLAADGTLHQVGGLILANHVHQPVQVPSGNRYVEELAGAAPRTLVLSPGTDVWADSPTLFVGPPVRTYDGTLFTVSSQGLTRFEADGRRTLAVPCAWLGLGRCAGLLFGGRDAGGALYLARRGAPELVIVDGEAVRRIALPEGLVIARLATGAALTVVLALRPHATDPDKASYLAYALRAGADRLEAIDASTDPAAAGTQLVVDHAGAVHVANQRLSTVVDAGD